MSIISIIQFIVFSIVLPTVLSILYSKNVEKYKLNYSLTKGIYYLIYAIVVAYDYLVNQDQLHVAGLAVTIAIFEGLPLLLVPLFVKNYKR